MPVLLAPTRVTASMVRSGVLAVARRLDTWTLLAFNPDAALRRPIR